MYLFFPYCVRNVTDSSLEGRVKWAGALEPQGTGLGVGDTRPNHAVCIVRESLETRKLPAFPHPLALLAGPGR